MKLLKKLAAGCIAATCLCASVMAIPSEAYVPNDALVVTKYLNGMVPMDNYTTLDANKDYIINSEDAIYINKVILGKSYSASYYSRITGKDVPFPKVSGVLCPTDEEGNSRAYVEYDYSTKEKFYYNLVLPESSTAMDDVSPASVIGSDSRQRTYGSENSGIVYLNYSNATGFIVGNDIIATAARNVYDRNSGFRKNLKIHLYNEMGTLAGEVGYDPVEIHVPQAYINGNDDYDYALIKVNVDLSDYTHFELGTTYTTPSAFSTVPIHVTGIPENVSGYNGMLYTYTGTGKLLKTDNSKRLCYDVDTSNGNAGSPVYTITHADNGGFVYTALAIDSTGFSDENYGVRISKYLLQFYKNNRFIG